MTFFSFFFVMSVMALYLIVMNGFLIRSSRERSPDVRVFFGLNGKVVTHTPGPGFWRSNSEPAPAGAPSPKVSHLTRRRRRYGDR